MIHTGYIRVREASVAALVARGPVARGTEALLDNGQVFVQVDGPTGTNWRPYKDADGAASFADVDMFPHDDDYFASFEEV